MKYRVVINAGHAPQGNPDPGAQYHGLRESDITCSVGHAVTEELAKRGYEVTFVQDDDLNKICNIANSVQANLFISLHCNAFSNESANGTEVFVYDETSNASKAAKKICNDICEALGTYNRGLKTANFQVLRDTAMPAMLIEMFFISNKDDITKFQNGLSGLITAICDGVDFYFS